MNSGISSFDRIVNSFRFKKNDANQCIYMKLIIGSFVILVLYSDDILIASIDVNMLTKTKQMLFKTLI